MVFFICTKVVGDCVGFMDLTVVTEGYVISSRSAIISEELGGLLPKYYTVFLQIRRACSWWGVLIFIHICVNSQVYLKFISCCIIDILCTWCQGSGDPEVPWPEYEMIIGNVFN
jgi:hypothetical protein